MDIRNNLFSSVENRKKLGADAENKAPVQQVANTTLRETRKPLGEESMQGNLPPVTLLAANSLSFLPTMQSREGEQRKKLGGDSELSQNISVNLYPQKLKPTEKKKTLGSDAQQE